MFKNITIVGVGLISGSFALAMKEHGYAEKIIGVSRTQKSLDEAKKLGIIDEYLPLDEAIVASDLIYIAIPVDVTIQITEYILDRINHNQIVVDAGSTKFPLCKAILNHKHRSRFIATHPMWGTEYSGPQAALKGAFKGRSCVICESERSDTIAIKKIEEIYTQLGMHMIYMDAESHDRHAAYISHISHITSFALANTVLEKETQENTIFDLAGGGFESTVRLAKSNPTMWAPIFLQNKENVLEVLKEHIHQLEQFKNALESNNRNELENLMSRANDIKRILKS